METTASAAPSPTPATPAAPKPFPASAPPVAKAPAASEAQALPWDQPRAQPRIQARPALRIMDGFVIALTVATACSLFIAAQTSGDSHSRELLPTVVMTTAR